MTTWIQRFEFFVTKYSLTIFCSNLYMLVAELKESKLLTSSGCWVPGKADHSGQGLVDSKSRMTISSTPKVEPFGKTVCVCVCMCVKEFFLTDIVLEGVVKVLETSQGSPPHCANFFSGAGNVSRFPTPLCNLFQWMLEMSQGSHPSVQSFSVDAGNVSRFPTPLCNLFQWMLEIS
jgi:hypothetical protein